MWLNFFFYFWSSKPGRGLFSEQYFKFLNSLPSSSFYLLLFILQGDKLLSLKTVSAVHTLLRRMTPGDVLSMVSSFCYPAGKSPFWSIARNLQIIDICEEFSQEASENDENWKECFSILCRWRDHIRFLQPLMAIQPKEDLYWYVRSARGGRCNLEGVRHINAHLCL